jgi:hypothetical protein
MEPMKKCPNDGAVMRVIWNEPMGISFICPVCEVEESIYFDHSEVREDLGGDCAA